MAERPGRPVQTLYATETCPFTTIVPVSVKHAMKDIAERHGRPFRKEVQLALEAWVDSHDRQEACSP
jgi:hypothetical protein